MQIYGLIGYPVKHSLSPLIHNAAFRALKINAEYRLFEIPPDKLSDFLLKDISINDTKGEPFSSQGIAGFNITIPHKVKARGILEDKFPFDKDAYLTQEDLYYVKLSGAVNTVKRNADSLEYCNTDAAGFLESLRENLNFNTQNKYILLIGCGGAGRAVVAALSWKETQVKKIYISDIKAEAISSARDYFSQFPQIKDKLEFISSEFISRIIGSCDLLVNATPCGMKENDPCIVSGNLIHRGLAVFDLIYNPKETKLLKIAREKGIAATNGLGMLLYQGAHAFEFWTGKKAPIKEMKEALRQGVEKL